jgi:hypothetical protein
MSGSASPPSAPSPLPPARERCPALRDGVRAPSLRAAALGYDLAPLPGLRDGHAKRGNFVRELLTQESGASRASRSLTSAIYHFVPCTFFLTRPPAYDSLL